jgi:arylsulfatase A
MKNSYPTRREFLRLLGLSAVSVLGGPRLFAQEDEQKPNVLLVMTDDQGYGDIHSHGNPLIDTPTLDNFAKQAVRLDRFFVSPVCAPTRASLLTGRYHLRTGTHGVTRGRENMRENETTIAQIFKNSGYKTACFGKWHNGSNYPYHPNARGFNTFTGFCAGHWNNYFDTTLEHNGSAVKTKGYIADVLTEHAIDFIEQNKDLPFFCYLPYNTPHGPYQVGDKYFDKYKGRGVDDQTAAIYGMCENIDDNFHKILEALERLGLAENTIVVFTTDNGPQTKRFNANMKGKKGSVDEGGVRVPLFIRWTDKIKPKEIAQISSHIDILPTLVELAGVKMPHTLPLDGISLAPLIEEKNQEYPDRTIFTFSNPRGKNRFIAGSVRTQKFRAVGQSKNRWRLYDMLNDPGQTTDLAKTEPAVLNKLRSAYLTALKDVTKDGFDLPTHIGYGEWPLVVLPAHEALLIKNDKKGISYITPYGWANEWIRNWTDIKAYPKWNVQIVKPGTFDVTLMYACKPENLGAELELKIAEKTLTAKVKIPHDPELLHSPDRTRRDEAYEKTWARLKMGTIQLQPCKTHLTLKALTRPGPQLIELKAVQLRKIK